MIDYTKEELIELLKKNPIKFNEWKAEQEEVDLSEVDFSGINLSEVDFTDADINSSSFADCSYAEMTYCNFSDSDMAGCILSETNLSNSDLTAAVNLNAARYDEDTVWPEDDMLPEDFDGMGHKDLSALQDEEDETSSDW